MKEGLGRYRGGHGGDATGQGALQREGAGRRGHHLHCEGVFAAGDDDELWGRAVEEQIVKTPVV